MYHLELEFDQPVNCSLIPNDPRPIDCEEADIYQRVKIDVVCCP